MDLDEMGVKEIPTALDMAGIWLDNAEECLMKATTKAEKILAQRELDRAKERLQKLDPRGYGAFIQ